MIITKQNKKYITRSTFDKITDEKKLMITSEPALMQEIPTEEELDKIVELE